MARPVATARLRPSGSMIGRSFSGYRTCDQGLARMTCLPNDEKYWARDGILEPAPDRMILLILSPRDSYRLTSWAVSFLMMSRIGRMTWGSCWPWLDRPKSFLNCSARTKLTLSDWAMLVVMVSPPTPRFLDRRR